MIRCAVGSVRAKGIPLVPIFANLCHKAPQLLGGLEPVRVQFDRLLNRHSPDSARLWAQGSPLRPSWGRELGLTPAALPSVFNQRRHNFGFGFTTGDALLPIRGCQKRTVRRLLLGSNGDQAEPWVRRHTKTPSARGACACR